MRPKQIAEHPAEIGDIIATPAKTLLEQPIQEAPVQTSAPPRHSAFLRFLFWFFLFPVIAYFSAFAIVRSASYEHWSRSQWGPMLDFAFETGRQNADVVVFGDSSAFIGIDPRLVNAKLGIKSIVLPATIGSLPITGDLALQRYLAGNTPPRLLVLYFSAWNLDYQGTKDLFPFEGEEMLFRHARWPEMATFAWHHPLDTLVFPLRLYSTFGTGTLRAMMAGQDRARSTAEALGHADDPDSFPPISDDCLLPKRLLQARSDATVQELARKYTTQGMKVMVYLAPVPACRNAALVLNRQFPALDAAPPAQMPPHGFLADPNFAHIESSFVPQASDLFATALGQRLGVGGVPTGSSTGARIEQGNRR